jgi:membrane associated rhomboid family serine protease
MSRHRSVISNMPQRLYSSLSLPFSFMVTIWLIHCVQVFLNLDLGRFGVYPREVFGLRGILFSPLIHADWNHLLANTPPLFVLSAMMLFFYRSVAIPAMLLIYFMSGAAVWTFGREVFHIGASGVIYGLAAFVFFSGVFRRNVKSIALALLVGFYYGSMVYGIFPGQEGVSWESHLLGALVGVFASFVFKHNIEKDEMARRPSWADDPEYNQQRFFLDRDTFDMTKSERELRHRQELDEEQRRNDNGGWFSNRSW